MIRLTERAVAQAIALFAEDGSASVCVWVRRWTANGPQIALDQASDQCQDWEEAMIGELSIRYPPADTDALARRIVDFRSDRYGAGFRIDASGPRWDDPVAQEAQDILDLEINPRIAEHDGHIQLVKITDGIAYVSMSGGCQGCAAASMTLRDGVAATLCARLPTISELVDVTRHDLGTSPFSGQSMY